MIITAEGLVSLSDSPPFNKNGSVVTLKKISETDWLLFGDIAEGNSGGFPYGGEDLTTSPVEYSEVVQLGSPAYTRMYLEMAMPPDAPPSVMCPTVESFLQDPEAIPFTLIAKGAVIDMDPLPEGLVVADPQQPEGSTFAGPLIYGAAVSAVVDGAPTVLAQRRIIGSLWKMPDDSFEVLFDSIQDEGFPYVVGDAPIGVAFNPGTVLGANPTLPPELLACKFRASAVYDDQEAAVWATFPECSI